jgi:hypothetical protein
VLGLPIGARLDEQGMKMAFFTLDVSDGWRQEPQRVAQVQPLKL